MKAPVVKQMSVQSSFPEGGGVKVFGKLLDEASESELSSASRSPGTCWKPIRAYAPCHKQDEWRPLVSAVPRKTERVSGAVTDAHSQNKCRNIPFNKCFPFSCLLRSQILCECYAEMCQADIVVRWSKRNRVPLVCRAGSDNEVRISRKSLDI